MREGLVGSCFHALDAGEEDKYKDLFRRLTTAEKADVQTLKRPTDVPATAEREFPLGVDKRGRAVDYDDPKAITRGTADMVWVNAGIAYVGDIKTGRIMPSPRSEQLMAYAFSWASINQLDKICTGIWNAREGQWRWSGIIALDSGEAGELWGEVVAAATSPDEFVTGPHCNECFQRLHCPARLLPHSQLETELAPLASGGELTPETAVRGLVIIAAMKDMAKRAEEHLRAYVRAHGPIESGGKVWQGWAKKGKRSGPKLAELEVLEKEFDRKLIKQGQPGEAWEWRKKKL